MQTILEKYGLDESYTVTPFGNGLINRTWVIEKGDKKYILQKINNAIFKTPEDIAENIDMVADYINQNTTGYQFVSPVKTTDSESMIKTDDGYYRLFPYVKDSHTIDVVETPDQAFEAAREFGKFTKVLSGLDIDKLRITLPNFHDLSLRYQQFQEALKNGNPERIAEAADLIKELQGYAYIAGEYEKIKQNPAFKLRVTHHDTKISNVLFNSNDKAICVIDLDTIMPGYFISDVGDMMRTYLSPVSEEEKDFSKIEIRDEFYKAIVQGYKAGIGDELSADEQQHFFYAGEFIMYMQALRFLTDYLNNDVYYGSRYEGHNYIRAQNQAVLLRKLLAKKETLSGI